MRGLKRLCGFDPKLDLIYIDGDRPSAIHYFRCAYASSISRRFLGQNDHYVSRISFREFLFYFITRVHSEIE